MKDIHISLFKYLLKSDNISYKNNTFTLYVDDVDTIHYLLNNNHIILADP